MLVLLLTANTNATSVVDGGGISALGLNGFEGGLFDKSPLPFRNRMLL